jgi:PEP-CTERM motif
MTQPMERNSLNGPDESLHPLSREHQTYGPAETTVTTSRYRWVSLGALAIIFAAFTQSAMATEIETQVNIGPEVSLDSILNTIMESDDISLSRVSDSADALWELAGNDATVLGRVRYSAINSVFGIIAGTEGNSRDFEALTKSPNHDGIAPKEGIATPFPNLTGSFRLAIRTPAGQILSSLATDNSDLMDHMVTWIDTNDPFHYFVAFEDTLFPRGDGDYNDTVFELNNVRDGPAAASIPEPATLALLGGGLFGLALRRHSRPIA